MQQPATPQQRLETYFGHIETTHDVLLVVEATRRGLLPRITRRLSERQRQQIRVGSVFVWREHEAGIKRWTDGRPWTPSRMHGSFMVYRECARRVAPAAAASGDAVDAPVPAKTAIKDGLVKKTVTVHMTTGAVFHVVCYTNDDAADEGGRMLPSPTTDAFFVTNAVAPIPYSLYPRVVSHNTFGKYAPVAGAGANDAVDDSAGTASTTGSAATWPADSPRFVGRPLASPSRASTATPTPTPTLGMSPAVPELGVPATAIPADAFAAHAFAPAAITLPPAPAVSSLYHHHHHQPIAHSPPPYAPASAGQPSPPGPILRAIREPYLAHRVSDPGPCWPPAPPSVTTTPLPSILSTYPLPPTTHAPAPHVCAVHGPAPAVCNPASCSHGHAWPPPPHAHHHPHPHYSLSLSGTIPVHQPAHAPLADCCQTGTCHIGSHPAPPTTSRPASLSRSMPLSSSLPSSSSLARAHPYRPRTWSPPLPPRTTRPATWPVAANAPVSHVVPPADPRQGAATRPSASVAGVPGAACACAECSGHQSGVPVATVAIPNAAEGAHHPHSNQYMDPGRAASGPGWD
ncbi:hypothetical protein AMAG_17107 [Allomyces macrogynus ATCC 38327]|uniref:Gti1/Pac2 family protein n=1 Tax=Allomyces macrogynus (strain ATCC 38327) TaxID=578462 RepID=A0A0L0TDW6_ALLM3|nr:hypothetical protein AMAG_17107 [Allomyces macrogynus ATCC 38327]|eukprot:KNE72779.1 hypothetical protein AMAG_17107 [Allomyces macrogynus ATCC 38327]